MDHQSAANTHAVERYLLDELTPVERDEFEAHFFDCAECAEAVRAGTILMANGRAVAKSEKRDPKAPGRVLEMPARPVPARRHSMTGIPAAAAAVLLAVTGYQNLVTIPRLQSRAAETGQARVLTPVLLRAQARGSARVVKPEGDWAVLDLELKGSQAAQTCSVEVLDSAGHRVFNVPSAPESGGMVEIALPAAGLRAGVYEILVREPASGSEAGRFPFQIQR